MTTSADSVPPEVRDQERPAHYNGLRAVACLLVLIPHLRYFGFYLHEWVSFGRFAQFGLFIFFFLSAFLITKSMLASPAPLDLRTWLSYPVRRLFRIWPLLAAVVVLDLLFFHYYFGELGPTTTSDVWQHLTFRAGRGPLWTLPVEVSFYYLLVPAMVAISTSLRIGPKVSAVVTSALFSASFAWLLYVALNDHTGRLATWGVHQYAPYFVIGCTTAGVAVRFKRALQSIPSWVSDAVGLGSLALTLLQNPLWWQAISPFESWVYDPANINGLSFDVYLAWRTYAFVPVMTLMFLSLESGAPNLRAIFAWPPLADLGAISFGVYLVHVPLIYLVRDHITSNHLAGCFIIIASACVLAFMLHLTIEMPGVRIGEAIAKWIKKRRLPRWATGVVDRKL